MHSRRLHLLPAVFLLAVVALMTNAQTNVGGAEWETISPPGEEFTVLMPKNSTSETAKFPYHKMELTTRLYMSSVPNGPLLAIASFSGIKSNPAAYSDFQRLNSYVDAFKNWFPAKALGKDAVARLTLVANHTFHGYQGREYKLTMGSLSGLVHVYATSKRFYAIVSLNTKQDEALQEKFLSSFVLPDRPVHQQTSVAAESAQASDVDIRPTQANPDPKRLDVDSPDTNAPARTGEDKPESGPPPTASQPNQKRPISGGMLNGKAIYLPSPEFPSGAAPGVVMVQVLIDEQGTVVEARAVSGPQHLHAAAVNAARLARFTPTLLMGEPVKVTGTISYNLR